MGLSTDPVAMITFDDEREQDKAGEGKKKISLVDYFYIKVLSCMKLTIVQSPSPATRITLCHSPKEYILAHGGSRFYHMAYD